MKDKDTRFAVSKGVVDLWFCRPDVVSQAGLEGRCLEILGDEEREQYEQLKLQDHRREYLVSHAFLRVLLSLYGDQEPPAWRFHRNAYGKPELANPGPLADLRFNLSHTGGLTLCAVTAEHELGVDVEYHANSQGLLEVADHYFSEQEITDLQTLPAAVQEQTFFRYWTLKEAYIKARGEGLSIPLDSFSFRLQQDERVVFEPPAQEADAGASEGDCWSFRWWCPDEHYTAALALHGELRGINLYESTLTGHRRLETAQDLFADL